MMANTNYYDEDNLYVESIEHSRHEEQIADTLTSLANGFTLLPHEREFLIISGYDPDTGEHYE